MSDQDEASFIELIRQVRAGSEAAARELVCQFEVEIRREVRSRLRLRDSRIRRVFDSMDVVQEVLQSFFFHAAAGRYELSSPNHLCRLLVTMAQNKLAEQVRYLHRARRDNRRTEGVEPRESVGLAAGPSPSGIVANRELMQELQRRLSAEEWRLVELRVEGMTWVEVASALGGTPGGCRKQFARAVDRVALELGLLESGADD